jgi:hypothetical protein
MRVWQKASQRVETKGSTVSTVVRDPEGIRLIGECLAGNEGARARFQEQFGPLIYRFAPLCRDPAGTEGGDFYVYVFDRDRLYRRLRSYQGIASLRSFLCSYVLPALFEQFQHLNTRKSLEIVHVDPDSFHDASGLRSHSPAETPEEEPTANGTDLDCLNQLTSEKRVLLKLLYIDHLDLEPGDLQAIARQSGRPLREVIALSRDRGDPETTHRHGQCPGHSPPKGACELDSAARKPGRAPPMTASNCPPDLSLSAWLDGELGSAEAQRVRDHLAHCAKCRTEVLRWIDAIDAVGSSKDVSFGTGPECPSDEVLVAYSAGELDAELSACIEEHLLHCPHCVRVAQDMVHWQMALAENEAGAASNAAADLAKPHQRGWHIVDNHLRDALRAIGLGRDIESRASRPHLPALSRLSLPAAAVVAVLLLFVALRWLPAENRATEAGFRAFGTARQVRVLNDGVTARARPGEDQPVIVTLAHGSSGRFLQTDREWTRIELPDGRRVWVRSAEVELVPEGEAR